MSTDTQAEKILVFDFGSQYAQLIARRVREQHCFAEIVRYDISAERVRELNPKGIVLSGGPASVKQAGAPMADPKILDLGIPVLGICYGMQWMCLSLSGDVDAGESGEYGRTELTVEDANDLLFGVDERSIVWMSHADRAMDAGSEFTSIAHTNDCPIAAVRHKDRTLFGIQFHPEVSHTVCGKTVISNFVREICQCSGNWTVESIIQEQIQTIQNQSGTSKVICGLSGGVDSSVTAALLHQAIGDRLVCIFVDNGLLRLNERATVEQTFRDHFKINLIVADAQELFLTRLKGVTDPQEKRTIIGHTFIDVFKEHAQSIPDASFLAQGTLYPDVIESGGSIDGPAMNIKTHHNVGGLPEELGFELIEPLRDLFKDEVRNVGKELGLPDTLIWRHPFPGPGLAVRCLGEVTKERLDVLRKADAIYMEELKRENWYDQIAQAFAVLLPIQSVGVMGDGRTYENTIALRAVTTDDFMTADWARIDPELLARISTRIINEVRGVNRVVYDISTKPPATIEWE